MHIDENTPWQWMILIAFALGIRHGFDLDHLATIDAITRTTASNRFLSRIVGFLFSFGHGIVVTAVSIIIGCGLIQAHVPHWLEGFGTYVSIFFLALFGLLSLYTVFRPASNLPTGFKSILVKKFINKKKANPFFIILIGALFAISFDTISQISLFAISATLASGALLSTALGLSFTLGMMLTDGLNGLFVSHLIQRTGRTSLILSRCLGIAISLFSLILAFILLIKLFK
jgi:nickel/cobalt transporter (NiCoT) family protein